MFLNIKPTCNFKNLKYGHATRTKLLKHIFDSRINFVKCICEMSKNRNFYRPETEWIGLVCKGQ